MTDEKPQHTDALPQSTIERNHNGVIDQQVRFVRRVFLALLVTCTTTISVLISIEVSDMARARKQLAEIDRFLADGTFELFQQRLDNGMASVLPTSGDKTLAIGPGSTYQLCVDERCQNAIAFELDLYNRYYMHGCVDEFEARSPARPQTLEAFRQFYNTFMTESCVLNLERLEIDRSVYQTGYVLLDPSDQSYSREDTGLFELTRTEYALTTGKPHRATISTELLNEMWMYEDDVDDFGLFLNINLEEPNGNWVYKDISDVVIPLRHSRVSAKGYDIVPGLDWTQPTFSTQFVELAGVLDDWGDMSVSTATSIVASLYRDSGGTASFLGAQLPSKIVYYWGTLFVLCTQYYLLAQLRELRIRVAQFRHEAGTRPVTYPWILLFGSRRATLPLFAGIVALPLATMALTGYSKFAEFGTLFRWDSISAPLGVLLVILLSQQIVREVHRTRQMADLD